jgi:hypothetical protein
MKATSRTGKRNLPLKPLPAGLASRLAALVVLILPWEVADPMSAARAAPPQWREAWSVQREATQYNAPRPTPHLPGTEELAGAVVRMPSHGGSATVIFTEKDCSYLLSCGHCFQSYQDMHKPIVLDIPSSHPSRTLLHPPRPTQLVGLDHEADLSLLLLHAGPLDFVCQPAPDGFEPGSHRLLSVGYDEMRLPAMQVPTHILFTDLGTTWTREMPWHGRSGGALIDLEAGYLVGVVSGYETAGAHRGIYVSQAVICDFLHRCEKGQGFADHRRPMQPQPFPPMPNGCGPRG